MNKHKKEMQLDIDLANILDKVMCSKDDEGIMDLIKSDEVIIINPIDLEDPKNVEYFCAGCDITESQHVLANYLQQHGFGNVKKAVEEFAAWVIDLIPRKRKLQNKIKAKVNELYGEGEPE